MYSNFKLNLFNNFFDLPLQFLGKQLITFSNNAVDFTEWKYHKVAAQF